jgi:hypothetical protein
MQTPLLGHYQCTCIVMNNGSIPNFDIDFMLHAISPDFCKTNGSLCEAFEYSIADRCSKYGIIMNDFDDGEKKWSEEKREDMLACFDTFIEQNQKYYHTAVEVVKYAIDGGSLYREAWIPDNTEIEFTGLSWAWDSNHAMSYLVRDHPQRKTGKHPVYFRAIARSSDIDIFRTLVTNIHYANDEREIRLLPNAKPFVTHICEGDANIDDDAIDEPAMVCLNGTPNYNNYLPSGNQQPIDD